MDSTEKITFEQLPQAVSDLKEEVSGLKDLINTLIHRTPAENADQWMNIDQLRAYHPDRPARSTIYDWVCQNRMSSFSRVDFPLPLRPTIPTISFWGTVRLTPCKIGSSP